MNRAIAELAASAMVIPVVVVDEVERAVPIARALVEGGLPVIEVTLRSRPAVEGIRRICAEVPDAIVGAGTITSTGQINAVRSAGARFLVSPGCTPSLLAGLAESGLPFMPGVATPSDVMMLMERDIEVAKLFPAAALGGITTLAALAGPFPDMRFCPTGGISGDTASDYLRLENVICVGGSWMLPAAAVAGENWTVVATLAREAAGLRSGRLGREPAAAPRFAGGAEA